MPTKKLPVILYFLALTWALTASPVFAQAPSNLDTKINAAADAYENGRYEEAARLFREIVTLSPKHAQAWHFLGQSLAKKGDLQGAQNAYRQVLKIQPTGPLADRTRQLMAAASRPKFPVDVNEDVIKAIESSPGHQCMLKYPERSVRVRAVVREQRKGNSPVVWTYTHELVDLGNGLTRKTSRSESDNGIRLRFVYTKWGGAHLSNETFDDAKGQRSGFSKPIRMNVKYKGTLCPFRVGAEMESSGEYASETNTGNVESKSSGRCRITEKISASTLHPALPGDAFVKECRYESTYTTASGQTGNSSGTSRDYFLPSLGTHFSNFAIWHAEEERHFLPATGYSYQKGDMTYTYERVEIDLGSGGATSGGQRVPPVAATTTVNLPNPPPGFVWVDAGNCKLAIFEQGYRTNPTYQRVWRGDCVQGLASGPGTYRVADASGKAIMITRAEYENGVVRNVIEGYFKTPKGGVFRQAPGKPGSGAVATEVSPSALPEWARELAP